MSLTALAAIATVGSFLLAAKEHSSRPTCPNCGRVLAVQNNVLICNGCQYKSTL